jgi:hypothetical protein
VLAGGAFVRNVLSIHDDDKGHDQRWRERPRRGALGPRTGQDTGVVHASVGSATATPAPVATAAQSAASRTRSPQVAATEALEPSSRSWSGQARDDIVRGRRDRGANLTRFSLRPSVGPRFPVDDVGELQVLGV